MAINLQKTLDNIRKKQGTYVPSTGKGDKIDLNKTLENIRAKSAAELEQRQAQRAEETAIRNRNTANAMEQATYLQQRQNPQAFMLTPQAASTQRKQTAPYPRISIGERVGQTLAGLQEGAKTPALLDSSSFAGVAEANSPKQILQNRIDEIKQKGQRTDKNGVKFYQTEQGEKELRAAQDELARAFYKLTGQYVKINSTDDAEKLLSRLPEVTWGRWAEIDANAGQTMQAVEDRRDAEQRGAVDEYYKKYGRLMEREDFAEKSRYKSTATGEGKYNYLLGAYDSTGFEDILYDYINKNETATTRQYINDLASSLPAMGLDQSFLQTMTPAEVRIYNYLYATEGRESANEYVKYIRNTLTQRQRQETQEWFRQYAQENPVMASAFSALQSPLKGLSYLGQAQDLMLDGTIDQNAAYNKFADVPNVIRQTVAENWGPTGSFLYQTGMSMADFLVTLGIAGGSNLSLAIMGSGAAADTVIDAKDRGLSDVQAFTLGTIAGAAEAMTERLSIESLMDMATLSKGAVGYIVKNALTEAGEEAASGIVNALTDILVSRDKSQWQQEVNRYFAQGMTKKQAVNLALMNQAKSIGLDALGGALSGGVMAGTAAGANALGARIGDVNQQNRDLRENFQKNFAELPRVQREVQMETLLEPIRKEQEAAAKQWERQRQMERLLQPLREENKSAQIAAQPVQSDAQAVQQMQTQPVQKNEQAQAEAEDIMETSVQMQEETVEEGMEADGYPMEWYFGDEPDSYMDIIENDPAYVELQNEARAGNIATEEVYENNLLAVVKNNPEARKAFEAEVIAPAQQLVAEVEERGAKTLDEAVQLRNARETLENWNNTLTDAELDPNPLARQNMEVYDGGQDPDTAGGERRSGARTGEQAAGVERSAGKPAAVKQSGTARQRRARLSNFGVQKVNLRSVGVAENAEATIYPEETWDAGMRNTYNRMKELGHEVVFVSGVVSVRGERVNGLNDMRGHIVVQADSNMYTVDQIADHEAFHSELQDRPSLREDLMERIAAKFSKEELDRIAARYFESYRGVANFSENMSEDEWQDMLKYVWDEILCDAWAEKNSFGYGATKFTETVRTGYTEKVHGRDAAANVDVRGPPTTGHFSMAEPVESVGLDVDEETESASPNRYSRASWEESDYETNREAAAQELASKLDISLEKAEAYIDSVNSIAAMIADARARLDYESAPGLSSFVSNAEYGGSFDFSTLCKKRRLLTGTFTAIQKALANTALTADEILEIRSMMDEAGLEVSCGLCYVEGSRANMGRFTKEFLRMYERDNPGKWVPNMAEMNTPDGIEWVRITHPEVYEQYEKFWNNYGRLQEGDPALFASQQKPKLYQLRTEYKGEVLQHFRDDNSIREKNINGGVRLQSFSDFEIVHLIDAMQIIMDMSRVGLAGQAYTKVPDFAWAFGDTGLKINLSLIAKGVDENGQLIFDDKEGMPLEQAMELRDRYSENVGTIIVTFTDEQLMAAMADDRIDFIIPFHRSQWKKKQYGAMGLPKNTKDYTYQQNEKLIKQTYHEYRGRMVKDKAKNFMPNEYWDFDISGKENAENYLRLCAENNKRPKFYKLLTNNGDGSYSLKEDGSTDGYWKLLIDFKMYDNDGVGAPQRPVRPDFNMEQSRRMLDEYTGGHEQFPVAQGIVDEFVARYKERNPRAMYSVSDEDYNESAMQYYALQEQQERERAAQKKEQRAQKRKERQSRLWAGGEIKSNSIYKGKPTGELLKTFSSQYSQEDFRNELMRIFSVPKSMSFEAKSIIRPYIQKILDKGALDDSDANMLFDTLYNYGVVENPQNKYLKGMSSAVQGAKIFVHENVKSDFGDRKRWNAFYRRALEAGVTITNDPAFPGIDKWNQEMATLFPGAFNAGDIRAKEILERIVSIAEEGKADNASLHEYAAMIADEYGPERVDEMFDNMTRQFDQAIRRFADKAGLEVRMRAREEFYNARERIRLADQKKAAQEERERKELQNKLLKELQYLKKSRKKSGAEWQRRFDEVLTGIDTYATSALPRKGIYSKKYDMTWEDIANAYDEWSKEPDFLPNEDLKRIVSRVKDKKLADMTVEDLEDLLKAAVAIHTEYENYQNMVIEGIKTRTSRVYNQMVEEVKSADNAKREHGKVQHLMNLNQLTPMNIIQRVAGWNPDSMWMKLAKNLEQGEREQKAYVIRANDLLRDFMTKNKKWVERADGQSKNAKWYELKLPKYTEAGAGDAPIDSGETVTVYMTPAMKVHLYLESKNAMNLYHIEHGGRKFVTDKDLYRTNRHAAMQEGVVVKLTPQAVREIVADLTPQEQELANLMHDYYNGMSREEINRVSNRLYGYDKAINEEYAPIWTDKDFAKQEPGVYNVTAEGVGSLKERLGYAATQTMNVSAFDAFNKSVDETSRFVGLSIPVKNWNTVMNWNKKVNQDETTPLATAVTMAWGTETAEYLRDLTRDYQQPYTDKQTPLDGMVGSLMANYISSVFASNPSVVLKQLGSYPMAMAYLGASNAPTPKQIHKADPKLIAKYSPELDARLLGYDIPEVAQVRHKKKWTQKNKLVEDTLGGGWITAMDGWVAKTLWPWAENKVQKETDLEYGTDEFYKRVAQEFDNAVVRSQSINDFMHRSNLMKSTNAATRTFTMFKSDSAQSYNMLREKFGVVQYMKEHGTEEQQKRASLDAAQAVLGVLANSTWSTLVTIVAGMLKYGLANFKDDEDEFSWAEVGKDAAENMVSNLAGTVIGGQEIVDLIAPIIRKERYWGIEEMGTSRLNDFLTEVNNAGASILAFTQELAAIGKEDGDWKEFMEENSDMVISTVKDIAWTAGRYFAGLPVENIEKYLLGLMRPIFPEAVMAIENLQSKPTKASLKGLEGEKLRYQVGSILDNIAGGASDETVEELSRLYELNDVPTETVEMTPAQEQRYRVRVEEILSEHLDAFVASTRYQEMDDEERGNTLNWLNNYANKTAKAEVLGTEEESITKKINALMDKGMEMPEALAAYDEYERAAKMLDAGLDPELSADVVQAMHDKEDENGPDVDLSDLERYELVLDYISDEAMRYASLAGLMDEKELARFKAGHEWVSSETYIKFLRAFKDKYPKENKNQERVETVLKSMDLERSERAALWQMSGKSWKAENNPFDWRIGEEIFDAIEAAYKEISGE